jgi:hypothetical protein
VTRSCQLPPASRALAARRSPVCYLGFVPNLLSRHIPRTCVVTHGHGKMGSSVLSPWVKESGTSGQHVGCKVPYGERKPASSTSRSPSNILHIFAEVSVANSLRGSARVAISIDPPCGPLPRTPLVSTPTGVLHPVNGSPRRFGRQLILLVPRNSATNL